MKSIFVYWNSACNTKSHYICTLLTLFIIYFICLPLTYKSEDWSRKLILMKIEAIVFTWISLTFLNIVVTYIVMIRGRIYDLICENVRLFDRIDGGLIVISDEHKTILFAN